MTRLNLVALTVLLASGCTGGPEIQERITGRTDPQACAPAASSTCTADDNNSAGQCAVDEGCETGACVDYYDGCFCGRGDCTSDADCTDGFACLCSTEPGMFRNACVPAECRTDADCTTGICAASVGGSDCCDSGDLLGLFCTTDDDACRSDSDCANGEHCIFDQSSRRFTCGAAACICD